MMVSGQNHENHLSNEEYDQLHHRFTVLETAGIEDVQGKGSHEQRRVAGCYVQYSSAGELPNVVDRNGFFPCCSG